MKGNADRNGESGSRRADEVEAMDESMDDVTGTLAEPFNSFDHPRINRLVEAGDRLGRYRVGRILGKGGTGDVFLGYGIRPGTQRRVAVKVLQRGLASSALRERFENECRILANLEHPNIARLYDARAIDSVRPYVVMEYVDGERIDAYCDRERLPIAQRLELVRDLCSAIELAHSKRVVHLDIKPGNVLVTAEGVPKLLDFGVAQLLGEDEGGQETTPPPTGEPTGPAGLHRAMTLGYASPEQILGRPLTRATDLYSLGMLLYKLLTGRLPFPASRLRNAEERRLFLSQVARPLPPSTAFPIAGDDSSSAGGRDRGKTVARLRGTTTAALHQLLEEELDDLVLQAIAHQPGDRFPSASKLAEALEKPIERIGAL